VTVRLTEAEAERLCRIAGERSLSTAIRTCIQAYGTIDLGSHDLTAGMPVTSRASIWLELRKAKRAAQADTANLEQLFTLEEEGPAPR
jgi:hypothetical protein